MSATATESNAYAEVARRRKARAIWGTLERKRVKLNARYSEVLATVEQWDEETWARFAAIEGNRAPSATTIGMLMEGLRRKAAKEVPEPIFGDVPAWVSR